MPLSNHVYAYALANPVNWTDPTGKCVGPVAILCLIGGGAAALAAAGGVVANDPGARNAAEDWAQSAANTIATAIDNVSTNAPRGLDYVLAGGRGYVTIPNGQGATTGTAADAGAVCAVLDQSFLNVRSQATAGTKVRKWNNKSRLTIVELGAGDYRYAIALKKALPNATVYATNDPTIWSMGKDFSAVGFSAQEYQQVAMYAGFNLAKAAGVLVGDTKPFTNQDLIRKGVQADIVYTVAPFPPDVSLFGSDAARLAKRTPGTMVAVMAQGADRFVDAFNTVRPGSRFFSTDDLGFESSYEYSSTTRVHVVGVK